VLGAEKGELRDCPFCNAQVAVADRFCPFCKAKVVIESLWLRSLDVVKGGKVTVHKGAQLRIGVPNLDRGLRDAATTGDVARMRQRLEQGAEVDGVDATRRSALQHAIGAGQAEAALFLVAMGADVTGKAADGQTALHAAASQGMEKVAAVLVAEGASTRQRDARKRTPADCAAAAGHAATAKRLGG